MACHVSSIHDAWPKQMNCEAGLISQNLTLQSCLQSCTCVPERLLHQRDQGCLFNKLSGSEMTAWTLQADASIQCCTGQHVTRA